MSILSILIVIIIVAYVIYRQFRARAVKSQRLFIFPIILLIIGLDGLINEGINTTALLLIFISALFSIGMGLWRASTMEVWQHKDGSFMYKATRLTFVIWSLTIFGRLVLEDGSRYIQNFPTLSPNEIPLFFGLTIAAQNLIIASKTIWKKT